MLPLTSVVLAAATWYLTGMAEVTRWLWSRYPPWLTKWITCPACAGAWWCAGWTAVFGAAGWSWFGVGLPWSITLGLLWGVFWVPLAAKALDWSLRTIGQPDGSEATPPTTPPTLCVACGFTYIGTHRCPKDGTWT